MEPSLVATLAAGGPSVMVAFVIVWIFVKYIPESDENRRIAHDAYRADLAAQRSDFRDMLRGQQASFAAMIESHDARLVGALDRNTQQLQALVASNGTFGGSRGG